MSYLTVFPSYRGSLVKLLLLAFGGTPEFRSAEFGLKNLKRHSIVW